MIKILGSIDVYVIVDYETGEVVEGTIKEVSFEGGYVRVQVKNEDREFLVLLSGYGASWGTAKGRVS